MDPETHAWGYLMVRGQRKETQEMQILAKNKEGLLNRQSLQDAPSPFYKRYAGTAGKSAKRC